MPRWQILRHHLVLRLSWSNVDVCEVRLGEVRQAEGPCGLTPEPALLPTPPYAQLNSMMMWFAIQDIFIIDPIHDP